jgi:putative sterol carrier protein
MNQTPSFTLRQTLEAMPLIFNPGANPGLDATIQFNLAGSEPGKYYLKIAQNECIFGAGTDPRPSLTINAPSEIWMGIIQGKISGQEAFMKGLYSAEGDFSLLMKWGTLFQSAGTPDLRAPAGQRLAGPIAWNGSKWMTAAFVPWIIFWITFGSFGLSPLVSIGLPWLLSAAIVVYRLRYNRPAWLDLGGMAFFSIGGLLALLGVPVFHTWGSVWSNLFMGALWLGSIVAGKEPLSMQYVKWNFDRRLWRFSLFRYINIAISVVWGYQAVLATIMGSLGVLNPGMGGLFTILRFATLVPAYLFTGWYPQAGMQKPVKDVQQATRRLQIMGVVGILIIASLLIFSLLFQR